MNFQYRARTSEGSEIQGVIEAADERAAMVSLSRQGMFVTKVNTVGSGLGLRTEISLFTWIPDAVFNTFLIQLSVLIKSGVPFAESLASLVAGETHRVFRRILGDVLREVEQGRPFSVALGTHPEVFNQFFIGMVNIAETGGVLDKVLNKLAKINQRSLSLRNQIIGALAYPALLLAVTAAVLLVLFGYSLPRFAGIFAASKVAIPLPTQILLGISDFASKNLESLFGILGGIIFLFIIAALTQTGRWIAGEIALRLPVTGTVVQSYLVVHISEMLGLLLSAGVPLLELLASVEGTLTMPTGRRLIENMRSYIERGSTIRLSLEGNIIFPPLALKLVETGEKTGNLDRMFEEISAYYDENLQMAIRAAIGLIEPMMLIFISGIVGFIMISVAMPIFQMSQLIGGGRR